MTKVVRVEAVGIKNIRTGSDPGSDLEIYGHLGAWTVRTIIGVDTAVREHLLMARQDAGLRQSISQGATLHIGHAAILEIEEHEELWVGGHLKEHDDVGRNDSLGDRHYKMSYNDLATGTREVHFSEADQAVVAIFKITLV
jgi:hypothetical protein